MRGDYLDMECARFECAREGQSSAKSVGKNSGRSTRDRPLFASRALAAILGATAASYPITFSVVVELRRIHGDRNGSSTADRMLRSAS